MRHWLPMPGSCLRLIRPMRSEPCGGQSRIKLCADQMGRRHAEMTEGSHKDSKWPWLFEQLELGGEQQLSADSGIEISLRAGKLSVAVSGPGSSAGDRRQEAVLSALAIVAGYYGTMLFRAHRTDAICISGDAGAALCTGTCHRQEEKWIN